MRINERNYLVNVTESDLKELETSPETFWEGVEGIGKSAFSGLKGLKSIVIPASVKFIGEQAFYSCPKLTEVRVLGGEIIEERVFANCGKLETIEFGDNVVNIGHSVCEDCPKLNSVTIGEKVEQIGQYAFVGCKKLQQLQNNSKNLKVIGRHAFDGCDLAYVVIPGSVETIEEHVFASNKNMQSVKIEEGVKTVQCYAFAHCDKLNEINLPDSLELAETGAFDLCKNLRIVRMLKDTKVLGSKSFGAFNARIITRLKPKATESEGELE